MPKAAAEQLRRDLEDEVRRSSDRGVAAGKASKYYELIRERKRAEVVRQYPMMAKEALSPAEAAVFRDYEHQFRQDLSLEAYQKGLALASGKDYGEAINRFEESIELHPNGRTRSGNEAQSRALASQGEAARRSDGLRGAGRFADRRYVRAARWLVVGRTVRARSG